MYHFPERTCGPVDRPSRSTRHFYSLENQPKTRQTIKLPTKNNLDTITGTHDIISETHTFYANLYCAQRIDPAHQTEVLNVNTPTLTIPDCNFCEGYIIEHESHLALPYTSSPVAHLYRKICTWHLMFQNGICFFKMKPC